VKKNLFAFLLVLLGSPLLAQDITRDSTLRPTVSGRYRAFLAANGTIRLKPFAGNSIPYKVDNLLDPNKYNLDLAGLLNQINLRATQTDMDLLGVSVSKKVEALPTAQSFATAVASQVTYDGSVWERKAGSVTPDGGVTLAGPTGFYYQRKLNGKINFGWYQPFGDGVTGNAALLDKALVWGLPVEVPDDKGKFCIERPISVTGISVRIVGSGIFTGVAGQYALFAPSQATSLYLEDLRFDMPAGYNGDIITVPGSATATESNATFRNLKGTTLGSGKLIYVGVRRMGTTITDCEFTGGSGLCLLWGSQRSTIQRNKYTGAGRAIQLYGGSYNTISGNVIDGLGVAITGITIFSWRSLNTTSNLMRGNVISNNIIYRVSEEGISMDMIGNDSTRSPEHPQFPYVTVGSTVNVNAIQIQVNLSDVSNAPNQWAYEYYAVVLSGKATGHIARINSAGSNFIMLDKWTGIANTDLAVGDKILITTGFIQNVITGNTVREVGTHGISMYGSAWGNRIIANTVMDATWRGISIVSVLSGGFDAHGYSGMNTVESNTLAIRDDPTDKYDTIAAPHASIMIESRVYSGGHTVLAPRTFGNTIRGNTLLTAQPIMVIDAYDNTIEENRFPNNSQGIILKNTVRTLLLANRTVNRGAVVLTEIGTNVDLKRGEKLAPLTFTQSLTYGAITAGGFQTQFMTVPGLKLGDVAVVNPATLPIGIGLVCFVTELSGVVQIAIRLFNYTAATITPGALSMNGLVTQKLPLSTTLTP